METPKIFDSELRFCEILWGASAGAQQRAGAPVRGEAGVEEIHHLYCHQAPDGAGVVQTEDAVVTALVSRDPQVQRAESRAFVERNFSGSLPGFLNAFVGGRGLSAEEADELRRMIADLEEKNHD